MSILPRFLLGLLAVCPILSLAHGAPSHAPVDLPNPLIRYRADPHILKHSDGYYYFMGTVPEYDRLILRRARTIAELANADEKVIWRKKSSGPMGAHIWAPEIHHLDGKWFIYFAAGEAERIWNIRLYVLENAAADPFQGEWIERGQLDTGWDSFALDASVFEHRGRRYLTWAQKGPDSKDNSNLYLAPLATPTQLGGPAVLLSQPELAWERVRYAVNEGPVVLKKNGRLFLTYSAAGTGAEYCVGMLTAHEDADLLDPRSWTKSPEPVFRTSEANGIFGPGHHCFTTAEDGVTDLIVYHARNFRDITGDPLRDPNRHTRVQPVRWRADGTPDFGEPRRETAVAPLPASVTAPAAPDATALTFRMGTATAPNGDTLTLDHRSLLLNGRRWTPVMGEFHFSRYPHAEWREALRKMKAGGIDIVATYVFWIHHEEIEGEWEWSGDKSLRAFVEAAAAENLKVVVRAGPWCHGEVRNGGLPDWLVARGNVRSDDPGYLASAQKLYAHIAAQCRGLLWKDGGPIIGLQLENEYGGPAQHLLTLKAMARELGFDVPLYTRTGWPELRTPMPFGEIVPLYGVYAEGFWDRETTSMPGNYWAGFHFSTLRTDANIANEALGRRDAQDAPDVALYPYLTCEIGGGMMSSYHRRIVVDPRDIVATTLVKLGSGSVSPGYYMYHGGTNPPGKRTTLMEEQGTAITNWNDMPVKNYDFQAPLGQYGQVRPHYAALRRLHTFLQHFGERLAETGVALPDQRPAGKEDTTTLRWSVRSDGARGFLFVNNHERGRRLPAKRDVQFTITFPDRAALTLPSAPVTIPESAAFLWPLNLDLGAGGALAWSTAQPLAVVGAGADAVWYFHETPGIPAEFVFTGARVIAHRGKTATRGDGRTRVLDVTPGREPALVLNSSVKIVLLDEADSLAFVRDPQTGTVRFDEPAPERVTPLQFALVRPAGPAREIPLGQSRQPVAAAPTDADFAAAAVWRIALPADLDLAADPLLRLRYAGDVARVFIGGRLINDDYSNGAPLEIGLRRHAAELARGEIELAVLPLRRDAVEGTQPKIFLPAAARPRFGERSEIAELLAAELITR